MSKLPVSIIILLLLHLKVQSQQTLLLKDSVQIFARDIISGGDMEAHPSFTLDNNKVFFAKATLNFDYIAIFYSDIKSGKWSKPNLAPFSGIFRDTDPFVSPDGHYLYFMSDRPMPGEAYKDYDYKLYRVSLQEKQFGIAEAFILPLPNGIKPLYVNFSQNGNAYFFCRTNGDADIYVSEWKDGNYQPARPLSFNDAKFNDLDPAISYDETFLIFMSANRTGLGGNDLYISYNTQNGWSEPKNLGPAVNTPGNDGAPQISKDSKTLYFSSYREKISREELQKNNTKPEEIFNSSKNGNRNIYRVNIQISN